MERWTIAEQQTGRFRPHINFGGRAFWCMFDYTLAPIPALEGVEVVISDAADADTAEWFPDLKRGMEAGYLVLQELDGRLLTGIRVHVSKIHAHPIDTTANGCKRYGSAFIIEVGLHHASRMLDDPATA